MAEFPPNHALHSWKEIAAHLGRDKRTVQRWEKERDLPVHHLAGTRGPVYAYTSEIDSWLARGGLGKNATRDRASIGISPAAPATKFGAPKNEETDAKTRFGHLIGDHAVHALASCLIYASLYALTLIIELTYQFDRFKSLAIVAAIGTFLWILISSVLALVLDHKLAQSERTTAFATGLAIFLGSAGSAYLILRPFLPDSSSVAAKFQTFTVQSAYLKDVCYFLLLVCIFWLPPFHFVASLERGIAAGKHKSCLSLVHREKHAVRPRGAIYPNPSILLGLWLAIVVGGIFMLFHLFDNLKPSPHMNLFMQLVLLRTILYFVFGTECLVWYYGALDEIKRQCEAVLGDVQQT